MRYWKFAEGNDECFSSCYNHRTLFLIITLDQLRSSNEPDREELCDWIKTITRSRSDSVEQWVGKRNMVDMLELVKKYYYNPLMKVSNSIKAVFTSSNANQ